jgi:hypothetical protein
MKTAYAPAVPAPETGVTYVAHVPAPSRGFAVTALVTGIVGSVLGLIPLFAPLAVAGGLVAIVFGLIAAKRAKRSAQPVGMARAGWILGAVSVALGVIGFAIVSSAVNELESDLEQIGTEYNLDVNDG